ncbi:MAG: aminotransferase class I/II-fold pyridoxal phosphate-dependent enzyme [Chitinophagaceae bacterium]
MINIEGIPGRTAFVDKHEYLFFSGFAYLGMPSLTEFQALIAEGTKKFGAVFPSSRVSNTRTALYEEFEEKLSNFLELPASASFSSGYMASQAAASFAAQQSRLLYSPGIHPSLLIRGNQIPEKEEWKEDIIHEVNDNENEVFTIVMESVNPLTGEVHDFSWLSRIKKPVRLLIDDSHGIGILGDQGKGIISLLTKQPNIRYLICYSLSKAFSCEGGGVSGDEEDITSIKEMPYFTAATGMSPIFIYAWNNSSNLFTKQHLQLRRNILSFDKKISDIPFVHHDKRLPSYRIGEGKLYDFCLQYHILLSAFRYPSETDPLMGRIVLNALHTQEDMEKLSDCIHLFKI